MKRLIASITLLLIIAGCILSCEKDDICDDGIPTTPSLIIEFYDKANPSQLKTISKLEYFVEGSSKIDSINLKNKMKLPLRTDADVTTWHLKYYQTAGGITTINTDILEFKYKRTVTYVSRACGFKTTFVLDPGTNENPNPLKTDDISNDGFWITSFNLLTNNIENENEAHLKIYF